MNNGTIRELRYLTDTALLEVLLNNDNPSATRNAARILLNYEGSEHQRHVQVTPVRAHPSQRGRVLSGHAMMADEVESGCEIGD